MFVAVSSACQRDCPRGYTKNNGDVPGWGSYLGGGLSLTRDQCAQKCCKMPKCQSFEHSATELKCNLNVVSIPSQKPHKDYVFCSKTGALRLLGLYFKGYPFLPLKVCRG